MTLPGIDYQITDDARGVCVRATYVKKAELNFRPSQSLPPMEVIRRELHNRIAYDLYEGLAAEVRSIAGAMVELNRTLPQGPVLTDLEPVTASLFALLKKLTDHQP